jgi:restriction system protein
MAKHTYYVDVRHEGLGTFQRIWGDDRTVVNSRADAKRKQWEERWQRKQMAEQKRVSAEAKSKAKVNRKLYLEEKKQEAADRTVAAEIFVSELEQILEHTLEVDDRVNFESLKVEVKFPESPPAAPLKIDLPPKPIETFQTYQPVPSLLRRLVEFVFKSVRLKRLEAEERARVALRVEDKEKTSRTASGMGGGVSAD